MALSNNGRGFFHVGAYKDAQFEQYKPGSYAVGPEGQQYVKVHPDVVCT